MHVFSQISYSIVTALALKHEDMLGDGSASCCLLPKKFWCFITKGVQLDRTRITKFFGPTCHSNEDYKSPFNHIWLFTGSELRHWLFPTTYFWNHCFYIQRFRRSPVTPSKMIHKFYECISPTCTSLVCVVCDWPYFCFIRPSLLS